MSLPVNGNIWVGMSGKHDCKILVTWSSLEDFLLSEVQRLNTLFDHNGVKIDSSKPTVPIKD
jgi:hypothetical protein